MYVIESIHINDIEWNNNEEVFAVAGEQALEEVDTHEEDSQTQQAQQPRK